MIVARRLYLYVVSALALLVWAIGVVRTLRALAIALWESLARPPVIGDPEAFRRSLSVSIALLVVGLPIWAVHWWLVERKALTEEAERRSAVRALFLSLTCWVTFLVWLTSGQELVRLLLLALLGAGEAPDVSVPQALDQFVLLVVAGTLWWYHRSILWIDRRRVETAGAADWLPRLYRYGAAAVGLTALVAGTAGLLRAVLEAFWPGFVVFGSVRFWLAQWGSVLVVGVLAWGIHWMEAERSAAIPGSAGERERRSLVRWTYLGLAVFSGLVATLVAGAVALTHLLQWALGAPVDSPAQQLRQILDPLTWALPAALVWRVHQRIMARTGRAATASIGLGPDWAVGVSRLLRYLTAFAGLIFGVLGTGQLIGLAFEALVAAITGTTIGEWRSSLASAIALTLVGGGTWAWAWHEVLVRTAAEPVAERARLSRRVYVYGVLGSSVLVLLGTAGAVVYQLTAWVLGLTSLASALSGAAVPLGLTLAAGATLVFHLLVLRQDLAVIATRPARRAIRLILYLPPESDPELVVQELASHVPAGAQLERAT